jgi:hypothetical protein
LSFIDYSSRRIKRVSAYNIFHLSSQHQNFCE